MSEETVTVSLLSPAQGKSTESVEVIDANELAKRLNVPPSWVRSHTRQRTPKTERIPCRRFGRYVRLLDAKQDNQNMVKAKNPHAQALGRLGGKARAEQLSDAEITKIARKGGEARSKTLSSAERTRIALLAVRAREKKRSVAKKHGGK